MITYTDESDGRYFVQEPQSHLWLSHLDSFHYILIELRFANYATTEAFMGFRSPVSPYLLNKIF